MHELKFAIHIHTYYSDGHASHQELIKIAEMAGLDGIITTDHNVWIKDLEGYYGENVKKVMLLVGEEVHNRKLDPPGNHMLIIGAQKEMSSFGENPQNLINQAKRANGLTIIAHPIEDTLEMFNEDAFSWRDWQIENFSGIELWNQMSEFKSVTNNLGSALVNALMPKRMTTGPLERTLALWDELIAVNKRPIIAIGGVDAHKIMKKVGPFTINLYPYLHHFKSISTHILVDQPLKGNFIEDRKAVLNAISQGHCFVAYDLPAPAFGFRFTAHNDDGHFMMGDQVEIKGGITFQIRLPKKNLCRLFRDGSLVQEWTNRMVCTFNTTLPGVYRVESFIPYKGRLRGWIFSNPIYIWH